MTFLEYLKQKKGIDVKHGDASSFMDEYYEEYRENLSKLKDGCSANDKK